MSAILLPHLLHHQHSLPPQALRTGGGRRAGLVHGTQGPAVHPGPVQGSTGGGGADQVQATIPGHHVVGGGRAEGDLKVLGAWSEAEMVRLSKFEMPNRRNASLVHGSLLLVWPPAVCHLLQPKLAGLRERMSWLWNSGGEVQMMLAWRVRETTHWYSHRAPQSQRRAFRLLIVLHWLGGGGGREGREGRGEGEGKGE